MLTGTPKYSQWKSYKQWCVQQGRKIWTCSYFEDFKMELAADQLADYLGHIRESPIVPRWVDTVHSAIIARQSILPSCLCLSVTVFQILLEFQE